MIVSLAVLALIAAAVLGRSSSPSHAQASPSPGASPAASPVGTPLPLFTQIPPSEARNVVGHLRMELTDRGFIPSRFECAINEDIVITLVNTGVRPHTFTIDELKVDVSLNPGETKSVTIRPPRLAHYTYYSATPEDRARGMQGIMTIFI
ncbi:MAG: cupredoxin domain-containing protein [Thermomicrobiales bacterium]